MVAAAEKSEQAGSETYQEDHMGAIFKEGFSFSGFERDLLAMNLGDGTFLDISGVSGADSITDGRGAVFADFDNDGDLDIFLTTVQGEAHLLYRNDVGQDNGFLRVILEGTTSGRDAFGAVVRIETASGSRMKLKAGGSGYVSQSDPRLLFGLGADAAVEAIEVTWPGGVRQEFSGVAAGATVRLVEGRAETEVAEERRFRLVDPLGPEEALLDGLGFAKGEPFPDLALQSLSGEAGRLSGLLRKGRRTLVNFWATWCRPCAEEMPELQRLHPDLQRAGVDLIGVSLDRETVAQVSPVVRKRGVTYPNYTTGDETFEALYPRGEAIVPITVLLDERGRVLQVFSGWSERSERALRELTLRR